MTDPDGDSATVTYGDRDGGARVGSDGGTTFTVTSLVAERVELVLFDGPEAGSPRRCVDLAAAGDGRWQADVPGVAAGRCYGYRVHGPWDPRAGLRCDPAKLLLDPWGDAVHGQVDWTGAGAILERDVDSAPFVPRSVVAEWTDPGADPTPLGAAWEDTVVYEAHVKGLTRSHPDVPPPFRGTYAALGHPAVLDHLRRLGVTAVELLPVHAFVHDRRLVEQGLRNYWGYQSIGWFAPHAGYAADRSPGGAVAELRAAVAALHAAGIEVILDVVFNHTAEGGTDGPTLSHRGFDNATWYRLDPEDRSRYVDWTGCHNTVDVSQPLVRRTVLASLRHWVLAYGIDGFRFDLATTLGRAEDGSFDPGAAFFAELQGDPVLAGTKLVAEPWDLGPDGGQEGRFPHPWREWSGRCRDEVRDHWRGCSGDRTWSEQLAAGGGGSAGTVRFVTCHDGFTLADLVAYEHKRNDANGEHGRDGTDDNRSWNCGTEGPTGDPAVLALRARQQRNLLASLLLSDGVPMLLAGDELGRTQLGNNNAYCQDGELSWLDWPAADQDLVATVAGLLALRRQLGADRLGDLLVCTNPRGRPRSAIVPEVAGRPAIWSVVVDTAADRPGRPADTAPPLRSGDVLTVAPHALVALVPSDPAPVSPP